MRQRPSVVLPLPDSPTRPRHSPGATSRSTPSTARTTPASRRSSRRRAEVLVDAGGREQRLGRDGRRWSRRSRSWSGAGNTAIADRRRPQSAAAPRAGSGRTRRGSEDGTRTPADARRRREPGPGSTAACRARPARRGAAARRAGRACRDATAPRTALRARLLDHAAGVHHHHAVAGLGHHREVVGDEERPRDRARGAGGPAARGSAPGW